MAYRTLEVDGKSYQYVVGRAHVKIKGVGVWAKDEVAATIHHTADLCECGCGRGSGEEVERRMEQIRPQDIASMIRRSER